MGKNFIVACGGTGGHSFPGLAVAGELVSRGHSVTVWMSGRDIESSVLKGWQGEVFRTGAKQLSLRNAFANVKSVWRCRKEMARHRPDALLAMGSYSSLPPVLAAARLHVPVVLHEANSVPGRAVEFLSRFAKAVAVSFENTAGDFGDAEKIYTGLPVRAAIAAGKRFGSVPDDAFCVFVTGGSQGAHRLNFIASSALAMLDRDLNAIGKKLYVLHQTGRADEKAIRDVYAAAGVQAKVCAFEEDMPGAFATANVVVARAGASTCFELALCGKPAFFIPLPSAMRNHQHFNALAFAAFGAAAEGIQESLSPRALANWLLHKASGLASLDEMSRRMHALARSDAAARVAGLVERVSEGGGDA